MRAQARKVSTEEDEESAFVSMTDMTVGFLFVVMILLAFFASQFKNSETVTKESYDRLDAQRLRLEQTVEMVTKDRNFQAKLADERAEEIARLNARIKELEKNRTDPLELYMSKVAQSRRKILERMRDNLKLDFPDLQVQLSEQSDALRFQGDGLFQQGSAALTSSKAEVVKRIAQRLNEVLPCYTFGGPPEVYKGCNPDFAVVEAVQIEGHTDSTGPYPVNTKLSADRATITFGWVTESVPLLRGYQNLDGQAVMSFAGYGPDRPIVSNETTAGQATNRRIDLRFIMLTPQSGVQLESIRQKFISLGLARP